MKITLEIENADIARIAKSVNNLLVSPAGPEVVSTLIESLERMTTPPKATAPKKKAAKTKAPKSKVKS